MIRLFLGSSLLIVCIILTGCKESTNDPFEKQKFNEEWLFLLVEDDASEDQFVASDFDDSGWEKITVPHTPKLEPLVVNDQWINL